MSETGPRALLLIRFPASRRQACKNSLSKWRSVHQVYEGCVSGVSKEIGVVEGYWPRDKGVALLSFDSIADANEWKDCIPEIKQHDWMDGPDIVMVPFRELPPLDKRFVQILDMEFLPGKDKQYHETYVPGAKAILQKYGASESVVATDEVTSVKGSWNPEHLIINFWESKECFEQAYCSEANGPLKEERQSMSKTSTVVFVLEDLFPRQRVC